jgi:hypothetical protein
MDDLSLFHGWNPTHVSIQTQGAQIVTNLIGTGKSHFPPFTEVMQAKGWTPETLSNQSNWCQDFLAECLSLLQTEEILHQCTIHSAQGYIYIRKIKKCVIGYLSDASIKHRSHLN